MSYKTDNYLEVILLFSSLKIIIFYSNNFFSAISSQQHNIISTISSMNTRFNDELVGHVVSAGGVTTLSNGCIGISGITEMSPTLPSFEPKYNYVTFNAANSAQIMSMIVINSQVSIIFKMML